MLHLSEALDNLHNIGPLLSEPSIADSIRCHHGDLKPENILVFKRPHKRDKLVIKDLGLTRFHMKAAARSATYGASIAYTPPEFDPEKDPQASCEFDIWSIGCVLLEFVVWLLDDGTAVEEFKNRRSSSDHRFFELRGHNPRIHTAVSSQIEEMRNHIQINGKRALNDLLNFIAHRLIQIDPTKRATAKELVNILNYHQRLNDLDQRLGNLDERLGKLEQNLKQSLDNLDERLGKLEQNLKQSLEDNLDERLGKLEQNLKLNLEDTLNQRLGPLGLKAHRNLHERLGRIESRGNTCCVVL